MKMRSLSISALAIMAFMGSANAQEACIQVIQPAVSPNGVCQEFANPCIVPSDWKSVPSCDLVSPEEARSTTSLESKMNGRIAKMRAYWEMKKAQKAEEDNESTNKNFNRIGSGSMTRYNRSNRLATSNTARTQDLRTFTEKNYNSDVAKRYSRRGGYERAGDTTSEERAERRAYRAPIMSRSDANRSGRLKSTVNWDVLSRQFTTPKNYGPNPYTLRSKYLADQKAERDASNQAIDVQERLQSRQRVYRGERMEGNLDGSAMLELRMKRMQNQDEE